HQGVELLPVVALPLPGLTDRAGDGVPTAQTVLLHLAQGDVHVVGPGQVAAGAHEGVVLQDVQHAGHREEHVVLGDLDLFFYLAAAALAVPVAVPVPASPAPSAGSVVITAPGAGVLGPLRVGGASLRELDVVQGRAPSLVLLASPGAVDGGALAVVATVTVLLRPSGRLLVAAAPLTLVGLGLGGSGPVLPGATAFGAAGGLARVPLGGQVGQVQLRLTAGRAGAAGASGRTGGLPRRGARPGGGGRVLGGC